MKRSEINQAIMEAKKMMEEYLWILPQWGYWSKDDYSKQPTTSQYLKEQNPDVTIVGLQPSDGSKIAGIRRWPIE